MSTSGQIEGRNAARNPHTQDKLCHNWLQGNCRFGSTCKFRHDPGDKGRLKERKKPARAAGVEEGDIGHKASVASSKLSNGRTDDNLIQSIHSTLSILPGSVQTGESLPSKTSICRNWKTGRCKWGEKCRFRHDDQEKQEGRAAQLNQAAKEEETSHRGDRKAMEHAEKEAQELMRRHAKVDQIREVERRRKEGERIEQERAAREAQTEYLRRERERRVEEERRRNAERIALEEEKRQKMIQAQRERDAKVIEQHLVLDASLVTFGAGLDIRNIVPGFDLCTIRIKNLPRDAKRDEIAHIFVQQGIKQADFYISQVKPALNKLEAVILASSEYGHAITVGLEGIPFRDELLNFSFDDNAIGNSMDAATRNSPFVTVTWRVPSDTIIAGYHSMAQAQDKARELNMSTWKGRQIRAVMNERPQGVAGLRNFNPYSVKILNLPPTGYVPHDLYVFTGTFDHKLLKSPSFNVEQSLNTIRAHFSNLSGVRMETYEIVTTGVEDTSEIKVKVQFEEWEDAKEAHASISQIAGGMNSPSFRPWLPPKPLRYTIKISSQQYEAQKRQWDELSHAKAGSDARVQPRYGNRGDVFIQVIGQDKKAAGSLKVRVENMVSGEKLGPEYWHSSLVANSGRAFFARIFDEKKVFIRNDFKTRTLRVYGESQLVQEARQMIKEEVDRLAQRETTRVLDHGSVGFFVREGLAKLVDLLGVDNVNLNLASRPCRITIKGGDEANHHLQRIIDESRTSGSLASVLTGVSEKETCPICTDEASHPEQLVCGHIYCAGCIKHFLTSAIDAKTFPLVCMGNDATCNVPITIPFIQRFLPQTLFRALVEAAFVSYLDQHPQELKYCTTPDCKQIYRHRAEKATLQCPSCFSTICPACDEEAHEDMTCEERRIHKNPAEQERLNEELARGSGYKKCPQCKVWIEKTEGCNHMACRCGAHICWNCMAISDHRGAFDGANIYDHMHRVHGNIYEQVPAGIDVGNVDNHAFLAAQVDELARVERRRQFEQAQAAQERALQEERRLHYERVMLAEAENQRARNLEEMRNRREAEERAARALIEARRRQAAAANLHAINVEDLRNRRQMEARRDTEERSWCIVM